MLCDEILADTELSKLYPGFHVAQRRLREARKFVLSPDFTAAADGLINNTKELERIAPFCRLPAPICWFELAAADRPQFMKAPMHFEEHQAAPKRVGFLAYAPDPAAPWAWITVLMWSLIKTTMRKDSWEPFPGIIQGHLNTPNNASQIVVMFDTKDGLVEHGQVVDGLDRYIMICISPFCPPIVAKAIKNNNNALAKVMQSDWSGEIRYLIAMLGLFNARNVVEVEAVDKTEHNRKRAKHGDKPLCSHTILKIRAMHRRSFLGVRGKGTVDDVREHFVIGHWKARRTGLFWWNPFWRGNPERGVVSHDYEVTT